MSAGGDDPCADEVCITCSDAAMPLRVREVRPDGLALVDTEAGPEEISVALVSVAPGQVVLVHAKEAIGVVREPDTTKPEDGVAL